MSSLPELSHPVLFLLSLPFGVFAVVLSVRSLRVSSTAARWTIGLLRMILVFALLFYLAGPRRTVTESETQGVGVLLDTSYSIPGATWKRKLEEIVHTQEKQSSRRPMSIYLFGGMYERVLHNDGKEWSQRPSGMIEQGRSSVENRVLKRINPYRSRVRIATGDVAALSDGDRTNRTVVLTDGYAIPISEGEKAWTSSIAGKNVTVVPMKGGYEENVAIKEVSAPKRVRAGEPISVEVTLSSTVPSNTRLAVRLGEERTEHVDVQINDGQTRTVQVGPVMPYAGSPPEKKKFVEIVAELQDHTDPVSIDDRARTGMVLYPPLRVLALTTDEQPGAIEQAMSAQGLDVERVRHPTRELLKDRLPAVDLVLIESPSPAWANSDMEQPLREFVRRRAGGMLVVPGTGSRARDWMTETRLGPLLPVRPLPPEPAEPPEPTVSQEPDESENRPDKSDPGPDEEGDESLETGEVSTVSLMLVIDTSGSMTGKKIDLVKEAAIATIETLDTEDRIGVLAFDHRQRWITRPITADRTSTFKKRIAKLKAGGGTRIVPALRLAGRALREENAGIKHMILLSDGAGETADYRSVVRKLREEDITVSTVATGNQVQLVTMLNIAEWGGGNMYEPKNFQEVPQIFTTEVQAVVKASEEREDERRTQERPPESLPAAGQGGDKENTTEDKDSAAQETTAEPMPVRPKDPAPFLKGLEPSDLPDVRRVLPAKSERFSFVSLEAGADGRPFMGYRYSGTGITGVILSGMNREDAPDWIQWEQFPQFVGQTTRFLSRERTPEFLEPSYEVERKPGSPLLNMTVTIPELKREDTTVERLQISRRGAGKSEWERTKLKRVSGHRFRTKVVTSHPGAYTAFRLNVELESGHEFTGYHVVSSTVPAEFDSRGVNRTFLKKLEKEGVSVQENLRSVLRTSTSSERREKRPVPYWPLALLSIVILADIYLMKVS